MSSLPRWIFPVIVFLAIAAASSLAESMRQPGVGLEAGIVRVLDGFRSPPALVEHSGLLIECMCGPGAEGRGMQIAGVGLIFGGIPLAAFAWLLVTLARRGQAGGFGRGVWLLETGRDLQCASIALAMLLLPIAAADGAGFGVILLVDVLGGLAALPAWRAVIAAAQASRARAVSIRFDPIAVHA